MKRRTNSIALALVLAATCAGAAEAQRTSASPAGGADAVEDGEIIVTAQRREQRLSDVGMSISAVDGAALVSRNITQASELAKLVPGLSVSDSGFAVPIYTLRGVGVNENALGSNSSVAVYVDEVPLAFPVMTQGAALDIQRLEVLKGPQGTLYGANSTGGTINYIPNKPTETFEAGMTGTYGRFNRGSLEGYLSGPLSETVRARITGRGSWGGNWQRSISRDDGLGRIRNFTGRAIVDFEPSDSFKLSINVNGWIDTSDTPAQQIIKVLPGSAARVDRRVVVLNGAGIPVTDANGIVITRPELIPGNNARIADWDPGVDLDRDDKFWQASARAEWQLNDTLALTSVTSFAHMKREQTTDNDGLFIDTLRTTVNGTLKSFAQELRLTADFSGIHWLIGANYGRDTTEEFGSQQAVDLSTLQNFFGFRLAGGGQLARQHIRNWAIFTNVDVTLTDQLTLSAGIRYSEDRRRFQGCGFGRSVTEQQGYTTLLNNFRAAAGLPALPTLAVGECFSFYPTATAQARDDLLPPLLTPTAANQTLDEHNVPWNINLNWKPTDSSLIYARVSRGFKSGNFANLGVPDLTAFRPTVQEELTAYELGGRFSLGHAFRFEAALFRYDYINKQLRARIFVGPPFGNLASQESIPKSRIKGAEFSAVLRPIKGLTLGASGTYIDSKILRYVGQTIDNIIQDQSGSPFNFTPKYSLNGDINYTMPVTDSLNAFAGMNVAYRSKTSAVFVPPNSTSATLALFKIRPYTLVDGQIGVESADHKWKVFVWGKNIFDKFYTTNATRFADVIVRYAGMPATYGLTATMKF